MVGASSAKQAFTAEQVELHSARCCGDDDEESTTNNVPTLGDSQGMLKMHVSDLKSAGWNFAKFGKVPTC